MTSDIGDFVSQLESIESDAEFDAWKKTHALTEDLVRAIWPRLQDLLTADPRAGLRLAERMISVALELNKPPMKALALRAKGNALVSVHSFAQGLEYFNEALKTFHDI